MTAFNLEDLGMAYRKAKVDLYYSPNPRLTDIADYEQNLHANLTALLEKINSKDDSWVTKKDFLGTWTLATKSIDMGVWENHKKEAGNGLTFSSPSDEWKHICEVLEINKKDKPKAEFRVMANCSIDFHVLSTLWILNVGHLFDAKLTDCAYGNRLRRNANTEEGINKLSLGSFKPYLKPFRDWRDKGIESMRTALDADKKIVALTADITSFYHELNPGFMRDRTFTNGVLKLEGLKADCKINRLFITALESWAATTPLKRGLPVGLPASAIVANVALIELDRCIEQQVVPIYYGRYVDDILLVMKNGAGFGTARELWEWLFARSKGKLVWAPNEENVVAFQPEYLIKGKSQIHFANSKNKVFMLEGETGKTLVDAISHQIHERASEWRAMPRLPRSDIHVGTDLLAATQTDGELADNLRKTDALTMRRAGFAIKLRDFEAYERDLLPETWKKHRQAFFGAFIRHVMVLPQFFDLAQYLPRVIRLATACEDFAELRKILNALNTIFENVEEHCSTCIKACKDGADKPANKVLPPWRSSLLMSAIEAITAAFPSRLSKEGKREWEEWMGDWHVKEEQRELNRLFEGGFRSIFTFTKRDFSVKRYQKEQARLFAFDLAHLPFRFIGLPKELVAQRGIPAKRTVVACDKNLAEKMLPDIVIKGNDRLAGWTKLQGLPHGILFATRPFNLMELFIINKRAYEESEREDMNSVVLAVRGFKLGDKAPIFDKHKVLHIPDGEAPQQYSIAVTSWKTRNDSWVASVMSPEFNSSSKKIIVL